MFSSYSTIKSRFEIRSWTIYWWFLFESRGICQGHIYPFSSSDGLLYYHAKVSMMRSTVWVPSKQFFQARAFTSSKCVAAIKLEHSAIKPPAGDSHAVQKTGLKHKLPGLDLPLQFMGRTTKCPKIRVHRGPSGHRLDWYPQLFPTALDPYEGRPE
jgi:hypothetical protein